MPAVPWGARTSPPLAELHSGAFQGTDLTSTLLPPPRLGDGGCLKASGLESERARERGESADDRDQEEEQWRTVASRVGCGPSQL